VMEQPRLIIRGLSVLSSVGDSVTDWSTALTATAAQCARGVDGLERITFPLAPSANTRVRSTLNALDFEQLDRSTVSAVAAARGSLECLTPDLPIGCVSIGSSRGPTTALERTLRAFDERSGRVPVVTSPVTTAGNISSWVAQEVLNRSPSASDAIASLSTSMTCSSSFHSLLIARSFVLSGMAQAALFGGAEACLTPYTVAQLEALRIYTDDNGAWPCQPFSIARKTAGSVALGEGAGTALLLRDDGQGQAGDLVLLGIGWALEKVPSATGISEQGEAFQAAMKMARSQLSVADARSVEAVVAHAPGTYRGDQAELAAIRAVFGAEVQVCTTKHLTGHTYGASGMVSLSLAQALCNGVVWPGLPYRSVLDGPQMQRRPRAVAINTAGFGGNAVTIIIAPR